MLPPRALSLVLGCLALSPILVGQTITTGLVGYWSFDEGSGTFVGDASGQGNNGTLVNSAGWVSGHFGNALYFPGTTGSGSTRVEIPSSASLQMTSAISFAAWVRVDVVADQPILAKEGPGGVLSYWFGAFTSSHFGMLLDHDGNQGWDGDNRNEGNVPTGTWVHLASTWDGATMINYINGSAVSAGVAFSSSINVSSQLLTIGVNSGYNTTAFTGIIDDLYVYNRALSSGEVNQLMASPIPEPAVTAGFLALVSLGWFAGRERLRRAA